MGEESDLNAQTIVAKNNVKILFRQAKFVNFVITKMSDKVEKKDLRLLKTLLIKTKEKIIEAIDYIDHPN